MFETFYNILENSLERDKFLSPAEAKEFGIIDKILDHPPRFVTENDSEDTPTENK